jgi:twitching motility protein PilT
MSERFSMSTFRLRSRAVGMKRFTVNDLASQSGVSKQNVYDFIRELRENNEAFVEEERLAPFASRPGATPKRYKLTSAGVTFLVEKNAPFVREMSGEAATVEPTPEPVVWPTEVKSPALRWRERLGHWITRMEPELQMAAACNASALLIKPDENVSVRKGQEICPLKEGRKWTFQELSETVNDFLTPFQQDRLSQQGWTACSYRSPVQLPIDISVRLAAGKPVLELRFLPTDIPTFENLAMPESLLEKMTNEDKGMILVTGLAASGRSAAIAAMVGAINTNKYRYITTIDEPIHYFHNKEKSFIEQKQVAVDAPDYGSAFDQALAARSTVVALADIKDREMLSTVLRASERSLIICRVTAPGLPDAIRKLTELVPGPEQTVLRARLAAHLAGIVFVTSLPGKSGGEVSATEVVRWHESARELILNPEKTSCIVEELARLEGGEVERLGASVQRLHEKDLITQETASQYLKAAASCSTY